MASIFTCGAGALTAIQLAPPSLVTSIGATTGCDCTACSDGTTPKSSCQPRRRFPMRPAQSSTPASELRHTRAPLGGIAAPEIIRLPKKSPERLRANRTIGADKSHFGPD
jgi:hypothetical protein